MNNLPTPHNEVERLKKLHQYNILDTAAERQFDDLTELAAQICNVPICLVSLIDKDRQWFKSKVGLDVPETGRDISFCQHAIVKKDVLEVQDSLLDNRFVDNPLVTGNPKIRFYAGAQLTDEEGLTMGTLCVIDRKPRKLNAHQKKALKAIANTVIRLIQMRKVNENLEQERKMMNYIIQGSNLGTWAWNVKTDKICFNDLWAKILGYTLAEIEPLETAWQRLTHPEDFQHAHQLLHEHVNKQSNFYDVQFRMKHKNGHWVWIRGRGKVFSSDNDGKALFVYGTHQDISNHKEIEKALLEAKGIAEETTKTKNVFLANMSHEIRTPLNAILGFTDLLKDTKIPSKESKYIDAISIASKNLRELIDNTLNLSKFEEGKIDLEFKPINVKEIVSEIIQMNTLTAKSKGIKLFSSLDHDIPPFVLGDPSRLRQILINLLGNAVKFTQKGYIEIRVYSEEVSDEKTKLFFSIKDTGIGIPQNKLTQIFERFTQAQNSTTREFGGSGLGLSIVKMLIELHQGKIKVDSELGKGTEFTFDIVYDISLPPQETDLINVTSTKSTELLTNTKILLVEDNEHNQLLAQAYLAKYNVHPDLAHNGAIAIEMLQEKKYDCILMDLQMPVMEGFQATTYIREQLKLKTPIIACSAHSLESEKQKSMSLGMNGYLTKPYSEQELIAIITKNIQQAPIDKPKQPLSIDKHLDHFNEILDTLKEEEGGELLQAMLAIFQKRIPKDIKVLETALKDQEFESLRQKSHLIAGSLSSLQFQKGYALSKEVEAAAENEQLDRTKVLTQRLIDYLNQALESTNNYK